MGRAVPEWEKFNKYRTEPVKTFWDLPDFLREEVKKYVEEYKPKALYVWGSYYHGYAHNRYSSQDFKEAKEAWYKLIHKNFKPESDLDLFEEGKEGESRQIGNLEIHTGTGGNCIYKNGKFI